MMNSRREETVLTRLRIGHKHVTHSHLLRGEPPYNLCVDRRPQSNHLLTQANSLSLHVHALYLEFDHVISLS